MEGTAGEGGQALLNQSRLAVDQPGQFCPIFARSTRHRGDIRLVVLADIGRVRVRDRPLVAHPGHGHRGVQATGEGNSDALANG